MILDGRTLILVADGGRARLFEEARRGGPLHEHPEWLAGLVPPHSASRQDRLGHTPHAADEAPRTLAEADFLKDLAGRLEPIFHGRRFDHLVLIAAPRALGVLRRQLSPGLKARLTLSEPHDRVAATIAELRDVVRRLRQVSA